MCAGDGGPTLTDGQSVPAAGLFIRLRGRLVAVADAEVPLPPAERGAGCRFVHSTSGPTGGGGRCRGAAAAGRKGRWLPLGPRFIFGSRRSLGGSYGGS